MSYLFLSFAEHLNTSSNRKEELYNLSLLEQFNILKNSLPDKSIKFNDFILRCFSPIWKKYYISCPNFLREIKNTDSDKPKYLNNIVIRPEITLGMKNILPPDKNIILIGDIYDSGKLRMLQVKGLQLIDISMSSPKDITIVSTACLSFDKRFVNNKYYSNWNISYADKDETYFTPDNIANLLENCYTVSDPVKVRETYDKWNKYIEFRQYYLDEQGKRNFKLDQVDYLDTYAINRKEYQKNSLIYDDYILDKVEDFRKSDMVILNSKIEEAESFPLIRLIKDYNKKAFETAKIVKNGKKISEEERKIYSLSSDNVFITKEINSKNDFSLMLANGYALGDRFKIVKQDIEPTEHITELEKIYGTKSSDAEKGIKSKYASIIKKELDNSVKEYVKDLTNDNNLKLADKKEALDNSLALEVSENKDEDILKEINNIKKHFKTDLIKSIKQAKDETKKEYEERLSNLIEDAYNSIDTESLYIARNNKTLEEYKHKLDSEAKTAKARYTKNKEKELNDKYHGNILEEIATAKTTLTKELEDNINKVKEEETITRFSLYFKPNESSLTVSEKDIKTINDCHYVVYDKRAEEAKIKRQSQALMNFYGGYVKNPYLSTYLFDPKTLITKNSEVYGNWVWYLESLNEKQKEAVRKAVASNGLFLLQGPPGTGKTQVIAETVAHLVKLGKKVLISSETHKAIDNVFERLPKIAEIVPIRLIPSRNKKSDNEYDPMYLVDNFYTNITTNMQKSIINFANFSEMRDKFGESYQKLELLKAKIDKNLALEQKFRRDIEELENRAKNINKTIGNLRENREIIVIQIDSYKRTKRHVDRYNFNLDDDIDIATIVEYNRDIKELLKDDYYSETDRTALVKKIVNMPLNEIDNELASIDPNSRKVMLQIEIENIIKEIKLYKNEIGETIPGKEAIVNDLTIKYKHLLNERNNTKDDSLDLKITKIFTKDYIINNLDNVKNQIEEIQFEITNIKANLNAKLEDKISIQKVKQDDIDKEIAKLKQQVNNINNEIMDIEDDSDFASLKNDENKFSNDINKFFRDFNISVPYTDNDDALNIIKATWEDIKNNYAKNEKANKEKIPMYEKIVKYLSLEEVIEADRKNYTKDLFMNANVFGITCTSNDRFTKSTMDSLAEYNIDVINLKNVDIDVVIIDEVSKSSFIDLLIPILYGKSVILVGDHRQLPPIYEFAKLRKEDFEGLDENIINEQINKEFTKMYEECFFKTLFEQVPVDFKTMLVQQYRCHEQIMNVFNHFYQGELKLGFAGQNNKKQHNINLLSNGRNIIVPTKHTYFINSRGFETHEQGSTSMYNTAEAKIVIELIKKLNKYFKDNNTLEKLSIGVICTYGDQARKIKEMMRNQRIKTDAFKTSEEKMIVSTVDDFQGDERDIIIVSMVRNPENPNRSNPGFILAYQRINVALSRARRLLIVVGNRKYLENKGVIDLLDIYGMGNDRHNFRVYEEIISTIERDGKIIEDEDVLEDEEATING